MNVFLYTAIMYMTAVSLGLQHQHAGCLYSCISAYITPAISGYYIHRVPIQSSGLQVQLAMPSPRSYAYKDIPYASLYVCMCALISKIRDIYTCEIFQRWLISATGSVATEQPQPMTASFTCGDFRTSLKKASKELVRWHWEHAVINIH